MLVKISASFTCWGNINQAVINEGTQARLTNLKEDELAASLPVIGLPGEGFHWIFKPLQRQSYLEELPCHNEPEPVPPTTGSTRSGPTRSCFWFVKISG